MKKIMFDNRFGLTEAVLEGRKTMTRRIIKTPRTIEGKDVYGFSVVKYPRTGVPIEVMALDADGAQINNILPKYKVGEVVAVAQSYREIMAYLADSFYQPNHDYMKTSAGYNNKMFVRADLMPHQIRITDVRVEWLQDISDEDCLREGIYVSETFPKHGVPNGYSPNCSNAPKEPKEWFRSPREAFEALIKKMYGKKTWEDNPWVFVYEFELVK